MTRTPHALERKKGVVAEAQVCLAGQVDGSTEYEWTQAATSDAQAIPNPLDTAPDNTLDSLTAYIYNLLTQDNAQQGSALNTLAGLVSESADRSLFLLNGDVCYARCSPRPWLYTILQSIACMHAMLFPDAGPEGCL